MAKLTNISLKGHTGIADWGVLSKEEIIRQYREYASHIKKEAEDVLNALDSDFKITVVEGVHKQTLIETLQKGA